ncbi:4-alpha-glucanotransferase [Novosphingobium lindaniclasticum]|uniref:4-alpha-glucanotransferase n=1 Tax=Novosphingobium lindaniclasticum LE124 TaxID=1096930 RepID=T0J0H0_9SPHN|nr:4-alpha-glucanotransferase [Novosphingobium lindaniclasticum]EQB15424.1 hypothetical protein L284_12355 [Novosphingobium lindaniclasticum LE124]
MSNASDTPSGNPLHDLAAGLGVARNWRGADGNDNIVADETLVGIVTAIGYPASSVGDMSESMERLRAELQAMPRLLTAEVGKATALPPVLAHATRAELALEHGDAVQDIAIEAGRLPPLHEPGYYHLHIAGHTIRLAVAPLHCFSLGHRENTGRCWGPAIQIPSLRTGRPGPFGDLGDLDEAVRSFAKAGADVVAISPLHAISSHAGRAFSPYTPSSRLFLNTALAAPQLAGLPPYATGDDGALIDWQTALPERRQALRRLFAELDESDRQRVAAWARGQREALQRHALFEALSSCFGGDWGKWPSALQDARSSESARFAADNAREIAFHVFAQWLTRRSLDAVQSAAREAGMAVGLIGDLAVGIDPQGSDAWAMQESILSGLTIGAPPDPLGPDGQNWGLTAFSPRGLAQSGFEPWLATLRATLHTGGGMRIDHAFGLSRLWVIPEGAPASQGAYLAYPFRDMIRLIMLESHLSQALIIAEDLGTRPPGFDEELAGRDLLGMRVLWFERSADGQFRSPAQFEPASVAMTSTHDTPTVAGWWSGRDIDWNEQLGRGEELGAQRNARSLDRTRLWHALGGDADQPPPSAPGAVVDKAISHVAGSKSDLAIVALEDLLGIEEQPNIPGTVTTHPNWRRRLAGPLDRLIVEKQVQARIITLNGRKTDERRAQDQPGRPPV